jgi:signal transduction histidine kinase
VADFFPPCVDMARSMATRYGVTVVDTVDTAGLPPVSGDCVRSKQVLLNLLSNAVKYNREGGRVSVSAAVVAGGGAVRFSVRDDGQGIPPERFDEVFEPFARLGAERSDIEGTGIGLVLSKRIVEMLGGDIGFTSTLGAGSTFWVEFPIAPS